MEATTKKLATNFDRRVTAQVALMLIRPESLYSQTFTDGIYVESGGCLADALGIQVMCKEYGDDADWIGLTSDDYEMVEEDAGMHALDHHYKTFEIWYPLRADENKITESWCVADVMGQAEEDDIEITEDEAREILNIVHNKMDASIGINWDVISCHISMYVDEKEKEGGSK